MLAPAICSQPWTTYTNGDAGKMPRNPVVVHEGAGHVKRDSPWNANATAGNVKDKKAELQRQIGGDHLTPQQIKEMNQQLQTRPGPGGAINVADIKNAEIQKKYGDAEPPYRYDRNGHMEYRQTLKDEHGNKVADVWVRNLVDAPQ